MAHSKEEAKITMHQKVCIGKLKNYHSYAQCELAWKQCSRCKRRHEGKTCKFCAQKNRRCARDYKYLEGQVGVEVNLGGHTINKLFDLCEHATNTVASSLPVVMTQVMDQVLSQVDIKCDQIYDKLAMLCHGVTESLVDLLSRVVVAVTLLWRVRKDSIARLLAFGNLMGVLGISATLCSWIKKLFVSDNLEGQGGKDWCAVVLALVHVLVFKVKPDFKAIVAFISNIVRLDLQVKSCETLMEGIGVVFQNLKQWFSYYLCGVTERDQDVICDQFTLWADEVDQMFACNDRKRGVFEINTIALLDRLYQQGVEMKRDLRILELDPVLQRNFVTRFALLQKMLDEVASSGARQQQRKEPYLIYLWGASGIGKSLLVPVISTHFLAEFHAEELKEVGDYAPFVYTRTVGDPRWDGVGVQKIFVYDDYAQTVDTLGSPNAEFMETIRLANSIPFVPDMAELSKKGRLQLAPELIIHTSNVVMPLVQSLVHAEAVYRRFDLVVHVTPKPDVVVDGRLDVDLLHFFHESGRCGCDSPSDICLNAMVYQRQFYDAGKQSFVDVGTPLELEHLLALMKIECRNKSSVRSGRKEYFTQLARKLVGQGDGDVFFDAETPEDHALLDGVECSDRDRNSWIDALRRTDKPVTMLRRLIKERVRFLRERFHAWIDDHPLAASLLGSSVGFALGAAFVKVCCAFDPELEGEGGSQCGKMRHRMKRGCYSVQLVDEGGSQNGKAGRKRHMGRSGFVDLSCESGGVLEAQGTSDPNLLPAQSKVMRSMYGMYAGGSLLGYGLIIKGRVMISVNHFRLYDLDNVVLRSCHTGNEYRIKWKTLRCQTVRVDKKETDIMVFQLPIIVPPGADLLPLFCDSQQLANTTAITGRLCVPHDKGWSVYCGVARIENKSLSYDCVLDEVQIGRCWSYAFDTCKGNCGSILFRSDKTNVGKIVGMHVAGQADDSFGISSVLSREMLEDVLRNFSLVGQMCAPVFAGLSDENREDLIKVNCLGRIGKGLNENCVSRIRPSPMHGWNGTPIKQPALLSGKVGDAWVRETARKKLEWPGCAQLDSDVLDVVRARIKARVFFPGKARVWSVDEACFGGDEDYMDPLDVNTSAGWPWVTKSTKPGKKGFIDRVNKTISSDLGDAIYHRLMMNKSGRRVETLWSDHLKDETRLIAGDKWERPRMFSGAPLDFSIVCRMYFGALCAHIMKHRILNGICVGINPHGNEWTLLAHKLQDFGHDFVCGDFKNFDGTMHPQLVYLFCDLANEWYGNDQLCRDAIFAEILNAAHLTRDYVYMMDHGNPSGNPLTAILNSVYLLMAFEYVLLKMNGLTWRIDDVVSIVAYGDDSVLAVRDEGIDLKKMCNAFEAELGLTLTGGVKSAPPEYVEFDEVEFLSRGFRCERSYYFAPRKWDAVANVFHWVKSSEPWDHLARVYAEVAFFELSHYSNALFLKYTAQIVKYYNAQGYHLPVLYPITYYRSVLQSGDGCRYLSYDI